jgi:hypothetical protein
MKKCLISLFLLLLGMQFGQAQHVLYLKKLDAKRKYQFQEGEKLKLKLKDSGEVLRGSWAYAGENKILISGQEVALQDIRWVDISGKEKGIYVLRKGRDLLVLAGLGYFAVSQLNALILPGDYRVDHQTLKVSGALVAGGLVCAGIDRALRKRKVRPGRSFRIYMIE